MTMEQLGLKKAQMQVKQDNNSLFQRSTKPWQNRKELVKDQRHFDEKMHQSRKNMGREKDKLDTDKKIFREERESFDVKMRKDLKNLKMIQNIVKILVKTHPFADEPFELIRDDEEVDEQGTCNDGNVKDGLKHEVDVDNLEGGCLAWLGLANTFFQSLNENFNAKDR